MSPPELPYRGGGGASQGTRHASSTLNTAAWQTRSSAIFKMEPIRSTSNNCLAHCVALAGPHGANLPPRDGYQIDSDSHVVRYISSRRRSGNAFTNYKKLQEFSKARQRLTQAAAPSDDCELARTLLPWPPSESESALL